MNRDAKRLGVFTGGVIATGVAQSGTGGLGFLLDPICTPLWFVLAALVVPSGEMLAATRAFIYRRTGARRPPWPQSRPERRDAENEE